MIDNPEPFALHVPRKVPLPLLKKTKDEIEKMLQMGVISRVDEPTPWCSPMVVTPKPNSDVRICVDLTKLNQNIRREAHPLPSVDFTLGKLAETKIFYKIDCNSAFWQRKLSKDSRLLTTFITSFGRFCFNRLPSLTALISTGTEQFQKVMTDLLGDIDGVEVQIDDMLVHGKDQAQHNNRLNQVLNRLAKSKITLNKVKCEFSVSKVKVLGHIVSSEGIAADLEKIEAIRNLATPRNVAEVRSFLGMVNHVS